MNEFSSTAPQPQEVGDVVEKAKAAGREVQSAVADLAGSSADALKDHVSHTMDAAKDIASSAQDRISTKITEQKGIGADYANNFADAMRRAAKPVRRRRAGRWRLYFVRRPVNFNPQQTQ